MATISPTVTNLDVPLDVTAQKIAYETMANGDVGAAIQTASEWDDLSVQVLGTFGTGGNVRIEGSNDGGTTWAALSDQAGNALDITEAGIKAIAERCDQVRPEVTAGDGTTALKVYIVVRRAR